MTDAGSTKPGVKTIAELGTRQALTDAKAAGHVIEPLALPLMPTAAVETVTSSGGVREPGRPKGSRNKRTLALLRYMESRYRSPLVGLAETWSRPTHLLANEINCTLHEAYKLQQDAMSAALPYWHQKLPQAIELEISDATGDTRTDDEIRARIAELAKRAGLPLPAPRPLLEATPVKSEGKQ